MAIDQHLLEILACIQCKGNLLMVEGGRGLVCEACQLKFPVRDDIPIMLLEDAVDLRTRATATAAATPRPTKSVVPVTFRITSGPKKGASIVLEVGTCKAVGRAVSDPQATATFHVDVTLSLDEGTRKIIHQYVTKQFRRVDAVPGSEFGFRRTGDIVIEDTAVSRLHAMLFADDSGVGVLDLVSKNGTYVNGEEIESRLLQTGDTIKVGDTSIVYEG